MKNKGFMKQLLALLAVSLLIQAAGQENQREDLLPPFGVEFDLRLNTVSWQTPKIVLLSEDFDSPDFPPGDWETTTLGKGWTRSGQEPFLTWMVPENNPGYALANDDSASLYNNGSMDFLVSPVIDLTAASNCVLRFRSYFTGAYGQEATVKYRTSPTGGWNDLFMAGAGLAWQDIIVDLADFSGPQGISSFQLAFHADDRGLQASGWALDDVSVAGEGGLANPVDYLVYWDGPVFDTVDALQCKLPFSTFGENHQFGICARYENGHSDTLWFDVESRYLAPPESLVAELHGEDDFVASWGPPVHVPFCEPWDLQFLFETQATAQEGGIESDGEFIYVGHKYTNLVHKYDLAGNLVGSFNIPGIPGLFDLAYDYGMDVMFGSHGGNTIYVMDFDSHTLEYQVETDIPVWGLACEIYGQAFWVSNQADRIYYLDDNGDSIFSFPVGPYGNYQGLAIDNEFSGINLWGFTQDSTGALLVEYDINGPFPPVISVVDVSGLAQSSGVAGGLFINAALYENCKTIGGILPNDVVFGYALYENLPSNWTPPGFVSYRLYNEDTLIYSGASKYFWSTSLDQVPNTYELEVSARYDLEEFGFSGEYAESEMAGPVFLEDLYGYPLDFSEDWLSLDFGTHRWDVDGQNWYVHDNLGNPYPSGVFRGMTGTGPYDQELTSHWIMVDAGDSCDFTLILDIKAQDLFPTGQQTLDIEVYDMVDRNWQVVRRYRNDTIMLDFMTDTIQLTEAVKGDMMKMRFHAYGIDSKDILFWIFDNIQIKRTCKPPENLQATLNVGNDSVMVTWHNPYRSEEQWIHYDDSAYYDKLGFAGGPEIWFDAAARWPDSLLGDLEHYEIRHLAFLPTEVGASYVLKIWSGDSAGTLLWQEIAYPFTPEDWYFADVSPPIPVDITEELWIGYSFSARGGYPIALAEGPAVDGYGNMVRLGDEWVTLKSIDPGLDYNLIVQAGLYKPEGHTETFQVYRSIGNGPFQHLATTDTTFAMIATSGTLDPECFRSRVVCYNQPNMIVVSDFSNTDCVFPVHISEEEQINGEIRVFPVPAREEVSVECIREIDWIEIFDGQGKLVEVWHPGAPAVTLNTSDLAPGIYMMKILTDGKTSGAKFIIIP